MSDSKHNNMMLVAALEYANRGWPIFPLNGKAPAIKGGRGYLDATTDPEQVSEWWTGLYQGTNIGIACNGPVWALDVDEKPGGYESLSKYEAEHGALPETIVSLTGGGGVHYIFKYDGIPIRNGANIVAPGIDVRSGGYIVAPPSIHPETSQRYEWQADNAPDDIAPAEAPEALLKLVRKAASAKATENSQSSPSGESSAYGTTALKEECQKIRGAANGEQEDTLNKAALKVGALVSGGELNQVEAMRALVEAGRSMMSHSAPWTDSQIQDKVERGLRDGTKQPRQAPEQLQSKKTLALPLAKAKPARLVDPTTIEPRDWLYGKHLIRGHCSLTVSPGGLGKSSLLLAEAVAMATGQELLNISVYKPLKVWYFNGEDPQDELDRRLVAIRKYYKFEPEMLEQNLFINTGRNCSIKIARSERGEIVLDDMSYQNLCEQIQHNAIDVLILDPLVTIHDVPENDNGAMNTVIGQLRRLATDAGCAIEIVHHVNKSGANDNFETSIYSSRGAVSLIDAVRSARVLNEISKKEMSEYGLERANGIFKVSYGKANLSQNKGRFQWRRMESVQLNNGTFWQVGDSIGVCVPWTPPETKPEADELTKAKDAIKEAGDRLLKESSQAHEWAGYLIAEALELDIGRAGTKNDDRTTLQNQNRVKVTSTIKALLADNEIKVEVQKCTRTSRDIKVYVPHLK